MKQGIYLYGVIQTNSQKEFGNIGIGENSDVRTVTFKDIAAVVSVSPLTVYDSLAKDKIVKDLVTHQFVIEKVMECCTIVPVKFGTMVETEEETIQFLEKGYGLLGEQLQKMEGKIELDVVASWELPKILQAIFHSNSQIQKKQEEIARKGDKVGIEDKVTLGKLIEQALKTKKARYHQLILQRLEKRTCDSCLHDVASEEMIFNAAFLLEKNHEEAFNRIITLLDQELENTVNFRVIGPLPLYSFSTIIFERIDSHKIEEAKKIFGLNGDMTDKTIRDTYRELAQKYHPDKSSGEDSTTFHLIHSAYRTLKNFIENGLIHVEVYHWEKDFQ
jgi:DnaJ-domain-containing protein 1